MRERLTCYIIDDEYLARQILDKNLAKVSFLHLKGIFESPLKAAAQMDEDTPDLLFLDINMPDLDAFTKGSFDSTRNPLPSTSLR